MKRGISSILAVALLASMLFGCRQAPEDPTAEPSSGGQAEAPGMPADLGDDSKSFGSSLDELNAYAGFFQGESTDITVDCISGTSGCYTLSGSTLTFTQVREDSVYAISGTLRGNIVIDIGDDYKFDLELKGLSLVSSQTNAILVRSGDEVSITAKSEYENYIYDTREAVEDADALSGAIHSDVDLEICGKGALTVISEQNNGIHSKDDLQVKNLTLLVACRDNALKGNDSVEILGGNTTLIAAAGDGIKTSNTDISDKGNQRGIVQISGGSHQIYAACDGIDAAYDAIIEGADTQLDIYTDKYSNYSTEVTAVDEAQYYIRFPYETYQFSVKYYNSEEDVYWVDAAYDSQVSGGRSTYYYYTFPKLSQYAKLQCFIYAWDGQPGQESDYLACTEAMTPSGSYDTIAFSVQGSHVSYQWANYTTQSNDGWGGGWGGPGGGRPGGFGGGPGGFGGGNTDKGDHSTKGIKAGNEITILGGTLRIKAYDDAIHAGTGSSLENGQKSTGNVTVSGGMLTLYSNDDGLHAEGTLTIAGGTVCVANSYEGLEGTYVRIAGGNVSVNASDDGINATTSTDTAIAISGGNIFIYCTGDGIDSNSRSSYRGIVFTGGNTVVISNSQMNSALDTEQGYQYEGGRVIAIMPSRAMTSEATHCSNFSKFGAKASVSVQEGSYLTVSEGGNTIAAVQMPVGLSAFVVYLGSKDASIQAENAVSGTPDANGVCWDPGSSI